jgi:flavin-binding protein dodecin
MDAGAGTTEARRRRSSLRAVPAAILATLIALAAGLTGGIGPVRAGSTADGATVESAAGTAAGVGATSASALGQAVDAAVLRADATLDSLAAATVPSTSSAAGPVGVLAATVLVALVLLRLGSSSGPRTATPAARTRTRRDRAPPRLGARAA